MSEQTPVEAAFIVVVNTDGSLMTIPVSPESDVIPNKINRLAGTYDIFTACREINKDIEDSLLVGKIASAVVSALTPVSNDDEFKSRIREKVKNLVQEQA